MRTVVKKVKALMQSFGAGGAALMLACALAVLSPSASAAQTVGGSNSSTQASGAARAVGTSPGDISDAQRLVTEFEGNGLKVLVKRRGGGQTGGAGLFQGGGWRTGHAADEIVDAL